CGDPGVVCRRGGLLFAPSLTRKERGSRMISQMNHLTAAELRKLFRGGKLKALLLLSFLIGVLLVFIGDRLGLGDNLPLTAIELLLAVVLPFFMAVLGS